MKRKVFLNFYKFSVTEKRMEQNQVQKTTKHLLKIALVFQIIYMVNVLVVMAFPRPFLIVRGLSGNYDLPFNSIYVGNAGICTVLFIILYVILNNQINQKKKLGIGTGILLGIFTYITYFVMSEVSSILYSRKLQVLVDELRLNSKRIESEGGNVASDAILRNYCEFAKVWFFIAIILMFIAYGIYSFYCKNNNKFYE